MKAWFHSNVTREKAEEMIQRVPSDGAFLVRPGERIAGSYAITFRYSFNLLLRDFIYFLSNLRKEKTLKFNFQSWKQNQALFDQRRWQVVHHRNG